MLVILVSFTVAIIALILMAKVDKASTMKRFSFLAVALVATFIGSIGTLILLSEIRTFFYDVIL